MRRPETGRTGARFGAPARRARDEPDAPEEPAVAAVDGVDGVDDVGGTEPAPGAAPEPEVGLTGARFGGRTRRSRKRPAEPGPPPEPEQLPPSAPDPEPDDTRPTVEMPRVVDEPDEPAGPGAAIAARPYVLTGGRTKVRAELRIETMVSATGPPAGESGERHTVMTLCARPRSVSEVAALTGVPLGVARVLIDDLATEGRLRVHLGIDPDGGPDMALLDRVLAGLRRL
jgi:hypothetical protein